MLMIPVMCAVKTWLPMRQSLFAAPNAVTEDGLAIIDAWFYDHRHLKQAPSASVYSGWFSSNSDNDEQDDSVS
jgi:hypothetical protein